MNDIQILKFKKFMIGYLVRDALFARQNNILEHKLLNPRLSVEDGFKFYEKIEKDTEVLKTNFDYIAEFIKQLSTEDIRLVIEHVFKNKSAKFISQSNNYSERTFFRRWHKIVENFFLTCTPSKRFEELLGISNENIVKAIKGENYDI